jgi:hypothetical protein
MYILIRLGVVLGVLGAVVVFEKRRDKLLINRVRDELRVHELKKTMQGESIDEERFRL